jgi:hypothetical protein
MTASNSLRGIIQRMALLRDMYNLANYVFEVQDTPEKLTYRKGGIDIDEAWIEYGKRKNIPEKRAKYIGASANEDGYVTGYGPHESRYTAILKPGKGSRLIEKGFCGVPTGLVKAWMDTNHLLTNLLWIIVGIIVGNIGTIVNFIQSHS